MIEPLLTEGLDALGLSGRVPLSAPSLLDAFAQALLKKNEVMNLTAITGPEAVARLHMLDCAALLNYAALEGKSLIDVGAGAGFPGVALKALTPSLDVTLLDAQRKRTDFLSETCQALGLEGIRAVHGRAEELGREAAYRERFDFAAARAVAALPMLCELCLPFVKVGGSFLAMKSVDSGTELEQAARAIETLGGGLGGVYDYAIPGADVTHRLIVIHKIRPSPERYPRSFGRIKKSPL